MAFSIKTAKKINTRDKHCVFGFIRKLEPLLHCNVPLLINHLILCYYNTDQWNAKLFGCDMILGDNLLTITGVTKGSAYLSNIINNGIYKWKFQVINISNVLDIGIYKIRLSDPNPKICFYYAENKSYGFDVAAGLLFDQAKWANYLYDSTYAQKPAGKSGDIIEMILNLNNWTLQYIVNGNDYGIAFSNIEKTEYVGVIALDNSTSIKLIDSNYN